MPKTSPSATFKSLPKLGAYATLACLGLALFAAACGETSATELARGGETLEVPDVMVYADDIRIAGDAAPATQGCLVCEPTVDGRACVMTKCEVPRAS